MQKKYLVNLRQHHKINSYKKNRQTVQLNDVVIIGDANRPRSSWRIAKAEKLIENNDKQIQALRSTGEQRGRQPPPKFSVDVPFFAGDSFKCALFERSNQQ